jgi:hypothetical protein
LNKVNLIANMASPNVNGIQNTNPSTERATPNITARRGPENLSDSLYQAPQSFANPNTAGSGAAKVGRHQHPMTPNPGDPAMMATFSQ